MVKCLVLFSALADIGHLSWTGMLDGSSFAKISFLMLIWCHMFIVGGPDAALFAGKSTSI